MTAKRLLIAFGLFVLLAICMLAAYMAIIIWDAYYYQGELGKPLQEQLGFDHGSGYLRFDGEEPSEVFTLERITTNGAFARAGVRSGDIPIRPDPGGGSITDFYRMLHRSRGTTITFTVVDGGNGPSPDRRTKREISVYVPAQ